MKIKVKTGNYYYKDLVGKEFDVFEEFDLLYDNLYFVKGYENDKEGHWFSKADCEILDEDYLKGIKSLKLEERLIYYNIRLKESSEKLKLYEKKERKEAFEHETDELIIGSLGNIENLRGKINLLKSLMCERETI